MSKRRLFPQEQERSEDEIAERRGFWIILIAMFLVVLGLLIFTRPTYAEHMHGHNVLVIDGKYNGITLACDTKEQIESVMSAFQEQGFAAAQVMFWIFHSLPNEQLRPSCVQGNLGKPVKILEKVSVFRVKFQGRVFIRTVALVNRSDHPKKFFITVGLPIVTKEELITGQRI